jgi:pimeloyl-ACP methyl ester carboxylesterase
LELVEGVGHFLMLERPEQINRRITDWLERTPSARDRELVPG